MIRYIVTKELEVDECCFESEDVGMFDTEKEAMDKAKSIFESMPGYEQQYYDICVLQVPEDSLEEKDNWETYTECEVIAVYSNGSASRGDDHWDNVYVHDKCIPDYRVHFCLSPLQDGVRLWIGDDPSLYVDRVLTVFPRNSIGFALELTLQDWFEQYGQFKEENWMECFPDRNKKRYLREIMDFGYTIEEAMEILRYLPQTDSEFVTVNVPQMIEQWKRKAPQIQPYRLPLWKKKILQGEEDLWGENIISPGSVFVN